eukprot:m.283261 g.283261  ORF g.283261 m.283261 type:complete len:179 (-) comp16338_c2_seq56:1633-2169(-)
MAKCISSPLLCGFVALALCSLTLGHSVSDHDDDDDSYHGSMDIPCGCEASWSEKCGGKTYSFSGCPTIAELEELKACEEKEEGETWESYRWCHTNTWYCEGQSDDEMIGEGWGECDGNTVVASALQMEQGMKTSNSFKVSNPAIIGIAAAVVGVVGYMAGTRLLRRDATVVETAPLLH